MSTIQFRRRLIKADMERMHLPEEYWTAKVDSAPESVREPLVRYLMGIDAMMAKGVGLLLFGNRGVGKTAISAIVAKEARCRSYTVLFMRLWEFREMLRSKVLFDSNTTMMDRAREVDVLVVDDLRVADATERFFSLTEVQQLIKSRGSKRKVTVVTSRTTVKGLREAPLDGLFDASAGTLVPMLVEGPDLYRIRSEEMTKAVFGE